MKYLVSLFLLISFFSFSQDEIQSLYANNCEDRVVEVFNNIISSIGNNSLLEPKLKFSSEERSAAYMSGVTITVERKLINLFCDEDNFEDKIAFILSHELGHYYLQHDWMSNTGLSYASTVGKSLKYKSYSLEEIKQAESQADIYAGFYGKIAGYKTLEFAESTLDRVYESYKLPRILKKYPSYDERVKIINDKKDQAYKLTTVFEIANVLINLEKYDLAIDAFLEILINKFNSREIYNNLGLSYLMYGISISEDQISSLLYPLHIDYQTRATVSKTRSNLTDSPQKMISQSKKYFEKSIALDIDYLPAVQNLYVSNILLAGSVENRNNILMTIINDSNLNPQTKVDFEVINKILNNTKLKKVQKTAKKGSNISKLNSQVIQSEFDIKYLNKTDLLTKLNIKSEYADYIFMGDPDSELKLKGLTYNFKTIKDIEIIKLNKKTSILKIPKELYKSKFNAQEKMNFKLTPYGIYILIPN